MLTDINQLLHPTLIDSLQESMPPVSCRMWLGEDEFEDFELTLFPFDTLDTLKRTISLEYKGDVQFLPSCLFVGMEYEGDVFLPLEYIWYPQGTQRASRMIYLPDPRLAMREPVKEFVTRGGGVPSPAANSRGRTTIEDVFGDEGIPTLQVFPLHRLLRAYKGPQPMGDADWYQRFYPYFPTISVKGPYKASKEDERFGKTIMTYLSKRAVYMNRINKLIEANVPMPELKVTGIKQLRLALQNPSEDFEDCETLFYKTKVTDSRPYMRIMPAEGMPISKVLVKGVLPIPSLDNPEIIQQWAKEISPTLGKDYLMIKYVHTESVGTVCPIYGTLRIFHDGTADILVQPPKHMKKLEPTFHFRHFSTILDSVFKDLPLSTGDFEIGEASLIFQLETDTKSPKFTKAILKKRLPFFSTFFQEIAPLKDQPSLISLRYKAISQFASEDNLFAFLTQYSMSKKLEGDALSREMLAALQEEFQLSALDGGRIIDNWLEQKGTLTVTVPEENEFMESFNPGIDIHVYPQHPFYTFHVHRIDSYRVFQRIYTLLALLFSEEEDRFTTSEQGAASLAALAAKVEETTLAKERGLRKEEADEGEEAEAEAEAAAAAVPKSRLRSFMREEEEEVAPSKSRTKASVKEKPIGEAMINPTMWFIKKLKAVDFDLFGYTPTIKDTQYSRSCQAQDDKMPSVLEPDQYRKMVAEYQPEVDAGSLFFNLYPLERGQKEPMAGVGSILEEAKEIVVSRYGSGMKENYFFCPELFCLQDEIMILEEDFDSEFERDGTTPKEKHTCPFCGGTEILSSKAVLNATVFRREPKKEGESAPLFIGFTKTSHHPDRYSLPCCHINKKTLRVMAPDFERLRTIVKRSDEVITLPVEEVSAASAEVAEVVAERSRAEIIRSDLTEATAYKSTVNYTLKFENLWKEYIVDAVKHPLEPGKFGILPTAFDAYFAQKSDSFIKRLGGIRQELKASSAGFLRMATQVGLLSSSCGHPPKPTESLLGVLAPLLYKNSIEDVRELLLKCVTGPNGVQNFVNANFGNLVNEFYVPSDPDLGVLRDNRNLADLPSDTKATNVHVQWAKKNLHVTVTEDNQFAVNRIFKSYNRFLAFMKDTSKRKDLRHFTSFLTEPGLLTSNIKRGLQVVVLEWAPGSEEAVRVKCGPYGFSSDHHKRNDFAFVWRDHQGYYELIVYTKNEPPEGGDVAAHDYRIRWKYADRKMWPRIVQDRVQEYMNQCKSTYRSLYTPQTGINPMALIPLSVALTTPIQIDGKEVYTSGLVRDSYNHAVMVLYPQSADEDAPWIPVPIVDDGRLPLNEQLVLDLNDFDKVPVEQLIAFYTDHIATTFPLYPGYAVKHVSTRISKSGKEYVAGIQLENKILVPSDRETKGTDLSAYERKPAKVIEWDINRELAKPCGEPEIKDSSSKKLDELYQYFRFMVSNWLAKDAGPVVRKDIERIVFSKLPEFEKRKRLEILCGNFIRGSEDGWLSWMAPDDKAWDMPAGFLRKDCRVLGESSCSEPCVWRSESKTCALHVDEESEIGTDRVVNTRILFSRRVIDELIRFPNRRQELMSQGVRHMSSLAEPIRDGDQYIIPERGISWLNLLRLDWMGADKETALFYEEMAQEGTEEEEEGEEDDLVAIVGKHPYQVRKVNVETLLEMSAEDLGMAANDPILSDKALQAYVKESEKPIGAINLMEGTVKFFRPRGEQEAVLVLVYRSDGISVLTEDAAGSTVSVNSFTRRLKEAWIAAAVKAPRTLRRSVSFGTNVKANVKASAAKVVAAKTAAVPASRKLVRRVLSPIANSPLQAIRSLPSAASSGIQGAPVAASLDIAEAPPSVVKEPSVAVPPVEEGVAVVPPVEEAAPPVVVPPAVAPPVPEPSVVAPPVPEPSVVAPEPSVVASPVPEPSVVAPEPSVVAPPAIEPSVVAPEPPVVAPPAPEPSKVVPPPIVVAPKLSAPKASAPKASEPKPSASPLEVVAPKASASKPSASPLEVVAPKASASKPSASPLEVVAPKPSASKPSASKPSASPLEVVAPKPSVAAPKPSVVASASTKKTKARKLLNLND
uniref:Uncharacterized protein n=1 Tax=viral metagenome TaxID=1070528 RepID=A0A6C0K453_9ZZZZ